MAHTFNARDCSPLPVIEMSQGDLISKSILVKNISPATREEDIFIHFQRKRNGGGEVDYVRLLGERTAVVTFEKSEVAESVMKRPQTIDGYLLTLETFGQTLAQQVFGEVSGRLNPNALGMNYSSLKAILKKLEDEAEVKWKEIFDGFVVSGTFQQMKGVDVLLKTKLKEKKPLRRVVPMKQFGEARATGQASTLPQCNLNEFNTCPKPLPENDQLKIKPTKRNPTKNSERQTPLSESAQVRVNQTYSLDFPTLPADNPVSSIDSFSANSYPSFEPGRFSASSMSDNCQQGLKEVHKRVETTRFKDESDFKSDFVMFNSQPKIGGDPLRALPQVKDSDDENKYISEGIQINGETTHLAEKSLVESLEISESKSKDAIPDTLLPSSKKKYKPRNGCDVQSKQNLPDGIKSKNESATLLSALNEVSTQVYVGKTETSESQRDDCDVQSKPSLPDGIKSENESATLLQALNKVSTQVYVGKTETSESQRDHCDVQSKPANSPDRIKSENESATLLQALNKVSTQVYVEKTETSESQRDGCDVQSKPSLPDGIKSENESATLLQALNKVSTQGYVEKTETSESQRDDCDVQSKPSLPDGIKSENESATLLQALNKVSTQVYVGKTETSESQRDHCDVQSKPANSPDGIKSENESATLLQALNKVSTQVYVEKTETSESQRDGCDVQSKPSLPDGIKSENESATLLQALNKVSTQGYVGKTETSESQRDDCDVQSKPANSPDGIKSENESATLLQALNKVSTQVYVEKTETSESQRDGCDVQSKPSLPDGIKSENESATLLQALNKVSTQGYVEKTETSESQRDDCDVQSKPSLPDGIKSENESATLLQALNKVSTQFYVGKTETSESQRDDCDVQSKPANSPDGIKSENESATLLQALNKVSTQVYVEKTETSESQRDGCDVQSKPSLPDGIKSENESATLLQALNKVSTQGYVEKTETSESQRDDCDVQSKPSLPDGIKSENESATLLQALNKVSTQVYVEKTETSESQRDDCDVQSKPANLPDGIKSENESATLLQALNKVSTQVYVEKTETSESQRDGCVVESKLNFPDGIKSENKAVAILPALKEVSSQVYVGKAETNETQRDGCDIPSKANFPDRIKSENKAAVILAAPSNKVSPQVYVEKTEAAESQRDGCDVLSKQNFPDRIKSENTSAAILPALKKVFAQEYVAKTKTETDDSERAVTTTEKARQRQENSVVSFNTSTGITVKLLVGDITREDGDVLLCPANPNLSYDEGLSKLILDKGGQAMKDECLHITQSGGPLKHGATVITTGGNLPFNSVLHAVLPSWKDQVHSEKAIKLRIHKCLKEGFVLASGYRMKSISLPPLGQSWIDIPVEMSAEIIARVVAGFSKNVGPTHSGITDVRIVCEDDETFNVFVKEFSTCSIHDQNPFSLSQPLKKDLEKGREAESSASTMRCQDKGKTKDSLLPKGRSSIDSQKEDSKPEPVLFTNDNYTTELKVTKSISALQPTNLPKEDTVVENDQADSRKARINPSSQRDEKSNEIQGDCNREDKTEDRTNCEWHVCETKISFDTSSFAELTEVSEMTAFETLEVKEASKVEQKTVKCMYVQDLNTSENAVIALSVDNTLPLNEEDKVRVTNKNTEKAVAEINNHVESVSLRPEIERLSSPKEKNGNSECTELYVHQDFSSDVVDRSSPSDQRTCDPFPVHMNNNNFITSPTVDGLLTADLHLGFQGLELSHGKDPDDRSRGNQTFMDMSTTSNVNESFSTYQKMRKLPLLGTFFNATEVHEKRTRLEKKMNKEKADSNLHTKTAPQRSRIVEGVKRDEELESEKRDELDATTKEESGVTPVTAESCHQEKKPYVSKLQPLLLCALCRESVDHPDLTNPKICSEHKFCDDCILRAFTFSSSCPACMNEAGLAITADENVNENRDAQQPDNLNPTSSQNHDDKTQWTANPAAIQANQPSGQMMWKKYETSLPGFEGYGTIAVSFCFYDGIQSSEHPNPGKVYKGASCVTYIPGTQEGREILKLLQKAFDARLIFTVLSSASDKTGVVALDGIELKTSAERYSRNGFPDPGYLSRLRQQLSAKGIR